MLSAMEKASHATAARLVFSRNLRLARRLKDLSQEALALQAGLSRTYISEVEKGARNISVDNMSALADAVGLPLRDLLDPELYRDLPG